MGIDVDSLAAQMFAAASGVLAGRLPPVSNFVQGECRKLAQTFATIEAEQSGGAITPEEATILLEMQRTSMRAVLTSARGLGLLDAEAAINAALSVARHAVNGALGFLLL